MIKLYKNIKSIIGFTDLEGKVLGFLLIMLLIGIVLKTFIQGNPQSERIAFNLNTKDKEFASIQEQLEKRSTDSLKDIILSNYKNNDSKESNSDDFETTKISKGTKIVSINSALVSDLILVPGIGEKTAQLIIEYRNLNGRFNALDELKNIKGIGDKKFDKMRPYIKL